jgi:hypothetical protein
VFYGGSGPVAVDQLTGSASNFAAASGVADGLDNATQWLRESYGRIFEGYYVPAGLSVNVHLEQEIRLDKEPDARQIRYSRTGASHARLD